MPALKFNGIFYPLIKTKSVLINDFFAKEITSVLVLIGIVPWESLAAFCWQFAGYCV